jgi:hypothetical protein
MSTDLVERLREATIDIVTGEPLNADARPDLYVSDIHEVADRIEALEEMCNSLPWAIDRLEALEAALRRAEQGLREAHWTEEAIAALSGKNEAANGK